MMKFAAVLFLASVTIRAQSFQPPSWGQGKGTGSGQGSGSGSGSRSNSDSTSDSGSGQGLGGTIQQQIDQLQSQIQRLRAQQRQQDRHSRPHVEAQSGFVTGHPISGKETRRTSQTLPDGTVISRSSDVSYFYRDSEGRMRAESPNAVEIFDPVGHFEYDVDPGNKTYKRSSFSGQVSFVSIAAYGHSTHSSISSGAGHVESPMQLPEGGVTEDLGRQTVNGVAAKGSRVTITIPAGTIGNNQDIKVVNERWYSDELRILLKSTNSDPRFGTNIYELTDIKQTPPNPALFLPPSDFTLTTARGH